MKPDELSFISGLGSERGMSASPLFEICSAQNALVGKVGSQKFFTKEIIDLCLVKKPRTEPFPLSHGDGRRP